MSCFGRVSSAHSAHMPRSPVKHTLEVPSAARFLSDIRRFVERHAEHAHLPEEAVDHLKLSVEEACINVIEHAYDGNADQKLNIEMIVEPTHVKVYIRDSGRPFNPDAYEEPNLPKLVRQRKSGGLGVSIIRQLMDAVEYSSTGEINQVAITKYRQSQP